METKKELRTRYKGLREALTEEEVKTRSASIKAQLLNWELLGDTEVVYGYYPLGKEASILGVLDTCLKQGRTVALPRVDGEDMDFYRIHDLSEVREGCFHVMEPVTTERMEVMHALVLVPGVAFDTAGNRIGYGKGYYDRYFMRYPGLTRAGIAYDIQITEHPIASWDTDQRMQYLVTEHKISDINTAG